MPLSKSTKFYYICLYIAAFAIPLPYIFGAASIALLSLAWLLTTNLKDALKDLKQRKMLWLPIILFALHAVSYFYSSDKEQSLLDLSKKASFVILPIVVGLGPTISKQVLEKLFAAFVSSLSLIGLFCLARAGYIWAKDHTTEQFFYHTLVAGLDANAIYYALYTIFSLSILLLHTWTHVGLFKRKFLYYIITFLQILFLVLLSSKTLLVFFILIVLPMFLMRHRQKSLLVSQVLAVTIFIISLCLLAFTNNPVRERYQQVFQNNENAIWQSNDPSGKHFNNLTLRLFIWKTAWQNIKENNLYLKGCGNGDVEVYQKRKLHIYDDKIDTRYNPYIWKFNLHNQFLQMFMMLGIAGLTTFILFIFTPFFQISKVFDRDIFLLFHLSFLFIILQESALQTQAGIIYYMFFASVFWQIRYSNKLSQNA
ncbi:MAG: O-antigen ligase family protein [Bacteroidetes bacterium]|nr:O-antigen ligase family protein [Bacteroidota bacterium]